MSLVNNSYDITVRGVENILLSDSQKVFMFPKRDELVIKKNRWYIVKNPNLKKLL